jgi:hypothetical protein
VIVVLEPPSDPDHFGADAALIRDFLDHQGYVVKTIFRSAMGAALVQFNNTCARDTRFRIAPTMLVTLFFALSPKPWLKLSCMHFHT